MRCVTSPTNLLVSLCILLLQNLHATDLETLIEGLHNSSWIKSQSDTNKQLVKTISKDTPEKNGRSITPEKHNQER